MSRRIPRLAVVGVAMAGVGALASGFSTKGAHDAAARVEKFTLGAFTFVGVVLAIAGGIVWWRRRHEPEVADPQVRRAPEDQRPMVRSASSWT